MNDIFNPVPFSVGELFGPMHCEVDGCGKECWSIWMTRAEYDALPEENRVGHVFTKSIGTALCDDHVPVKKKSMQQNLF